MATSPLLKKARRVAHKRLGIAKPYKHQRQAWKASIEHDQDVLMVMPTGAGKSLAFQIPCIVRKGLAIVISPLLALMREQTDRLANAGVRAYRIGMDMSRADIKKTLSAIEMRKAKVVYVSPERLSNSDFLDALTTRSVRTLVVDESHVCSIWSRDFRPAYRQIGTFRRRFPKAIVIAVTATADSWVEKDVVRVLRLADYKRIVGPPHRPNLVYEAVYDAPVNGIVGALNNARDLGGSGCGIVYCGSRRCVDSTVGQRLRYGTDLKIATYHAGLGAHERQRVQDAYMDDEYDLIVATNAFGMGVDKEDVRLVYHYDYPESIFAYAQESGRGGRDGDPALCVLNIASSGDRIRGFLKNIANPKYYVYTNLWRAIKRHGKYKTFHLTTAQLDKIGGSSLDGASMSAIRYMEYKQCVRTTTFELIYTLQTLRPNEAQDICYAANVKHYLDDDNKLVIILPADYNGSVLVRLQRAHAVVMNRPIEKLLIERVSNSLTVTETDVETKLDRAEAGLNSVLAFARAKDKHAFINDAFLK